MFENLLFDTTHTIRTFISIDLLSLIRSFDSTNFWWTAPSYKQLSATESSKMQSPVFVPNMMETPWTAEEHNLFLQGYLLYGNGWIEIAEIVRTRNAYQVCSYASWLENQGCLPRLPPIQQSAQLQRAAGYAPTAIAATPTIAEDKAKTKLAPTTEHKFNKGLWSKEEHALFLKGIEQCGRGNWTSIAGVIKTRNPTQVVSHARPYFKKLDQSTGKIMNVSGTKRKAPEPQEPKEKKKPAARKTTKEATKTKAAVSLPQQRHVSSSTSSGVQPVPSAPSFLPETFIESAAAGNPTLDIHPPSAKIENTCGHVIPPQREKVIGDKTGTKQEITKQKAIELCDPSFESTHDPEDVVITPLSFLLGKMAMVAIITTIFLVPILLARTIFVHSGSGNDEISSEPVADLEL